MIAKKFVLAIVQRWARKTIWLVKWNMGEGHTECRWFRSEEKARDYGGMILGAVITRETFSGDDHPTLSDDLPPDQAVRYDEAHG